MKHLHSKPCHFIQFKNRSFIINLIQVLKERFREKRVFVFSADITKTTYDSMIEKVGEAVRGGEDEPTEEKEWLLFLILPPLVLMPWLTVRYPTSSGIFAI